MDWNLQTKFLPQGTHSDHCPSITSLHNPSPHYMRPFRFCNFWTNHDNFIAIVSSYWQVQVEGTKQYILCKKLTALKTLLKELHKQNYSHISERVNRGREHLHYLQTLFMSNLNNSEIQQEIAEEIKKQRHLEDCETNFLMQVLKHKHIKNQDRATKYFYSLIRSNGGRKGIYSIHTDRGPTTSYQELIDNFLSYYQSILGEDSVNTLSVEQEVLDRGPKISAMEASNLEAPVEEAEIKDALWSIVKEFFRKGKLLKQINSTFVSLIPKTNHEPKVQDFRPISCCNTVYKIISKILAARLRNCLPSLINQSQFGFIKGRKMRDCVMLAEEIFRGYGRRTGNISPRMAVKVDISKAYDSVSWKYLFELLMGLGFPSKFRNWIEECVTTPSYSLLINGKPEGFFKGKRGLR